MQNIFAIIFPLFFQLAETHREKISEIPQKKPPTPYGMSGKTKHMSNEYLLSLFSACHIAATHRLELLEVLA